jgi:hypothetical protein
MGARSAKQRAAVRTSTRASKKRLGKAASLDPTTPTVPMTVQHTSAPVDASEEQATTLTASEEVPAAPTHATQGIQKNPLTNVEQDLAEPASNNDTEVVPEQVVLPERQARGRFTAMLAEIAEQPEFDDADRSIGNYDFHDEEWDSWKAGPVECEDEFDSEDESDNSESDETGSIVTMIRANRAPTKPPSRQSSVDAFSKPANKLKAARGSKRKCKDLNHDLDGDSDLEPQSECLVV